MSSGVSGFVAHAVAFGKILAPGLTLSQWTSSGRFVTEESSSVTPVCSVVSFTQAAFSLHPNLRSLLLLPHRFQASPCFR